MFHWVVSERSYRFIVRVFDNRKPFHRHFKRRLRRLSLKDLLRSFCTFSSHLKLGKTRFTRREAKVQSTARHVAKETREGLSTKILLLRGPT